MEFLESSYLVNDSATKMYAFTLDSVALQQKPENKDRCSGEKPEELESGAICHCHGNTKDTEHRAHEHVYAKWRLCAASGICFVFMIAEVVGGHIAGSLAVATDAAHLFIDLTSFLLSLFSLWLSSKPPSKRLTFGWHRAEILGALLSILGVWAVTGVLVYLACERLLYPDYQIQATVMIIVSGCAVAANIVLSVILHQRHSGHHHKDVQTNASVRAAFVHALGDLFQSISVLTSALIIYFKIHISGKETLTDLAWVLYLLVVLLGSGRVEYLNNYPTNITHTGGEPDYKVADPICTFIFSVLVLASTVTILKDFSVLLMEGVPKNLTYNGVRELILAVDGVVSVHSLHIWSLTMNKVILSAHVAAAASWDSQGVRREIANTLSKSFPVHSLTIQMESPADQDPDCLCCAAPRD